MCRVPVASVEDADYVVAHDREGLEEADESMLVVDLLLGWVAWSALGPWRGEEEDGKRKFGSEP
jgi:hypothetical protein